MTDIEKLSAELLVIVSRSPDIETIPFGLLIRSKSSFSVRILMRHSNHTRLHTLLRGRRRAVREVGALHVGGQGKFHRG